MKTALVTGVTSGIGYEISKMLLEKNITLVGIARSQEKINAIRKIIDIDVVKYDLGRDDLSGLYKQIEKYKIDILINNAGVANGIQGMKNLTDEDIQESINVNLCSPIKITNYILERMLAYDSGHIINIGSVAGLHTISSPLYGATKAGLHMFTQNLKNNLFNTRIRICDICPGRVSTSFFVGAKGSTVNLDKIRDTGIKNLQPQEIARIVELVIDMPCNVDINTIEVMPLNQAVGGIRQGYE